MRLLRVFVALVLISASLPARASEFKLQLKTDFGPIPMAVNSKDGVWFPNVDAEYLLTLRSVTVPSLVSIINDQDKMNLSLQNQLKLYQTVDALQADKDAILKHSLTTCQDQLTKEQTKNDVWYKRNEALVGAGFVSGILVALLIARAVN